MQNLQKKIPQRILGYQKTLFRMAGPGVLLIPLYLTVERLLLSRDSFLGPA